MVVNRAAERPLPRKDLFTTDIRCPRAVPTRQAISTRSDELSPFGVICRERLCSCGNQLKYPSSNPVVWVIIRAQSGHAGWVGVSVIQRRSDRSVPLRRCLAQVSGVSGQPIPDERGHRQDNYWTFA